MIYCPNCNTSNRDGSKFCNECGTRLPQTESQQPTAPARTPEQDLPDVSQWIDDQPWLTGATGEGPGAGPAPTAEPADLSNLLGGLQGTLPVQSWTQRLRPQEVDWPAAEPPSIQPAHLPALAGPAPEPWEPSAARRPESRPRPTRPSRLLWLILLAAVTIPLLLEPLLGPPAVSPVIPTGAEQAFATVDDLSNTSIVLVAWDFDPSTAGEMSLLADALVGHLLSRGAQLITLSLLPAGPPLAQAQIARLMRENPSLTGIQPPPIALGYLPGGDIALAAFGRDPLQAVPAPAPEAAPALQAQRQALRNLQGVDLLLVLTAEADGARAWVEQVSSRTGVRTVMGLSAAAGPGVRPYLDAGQVAGLVEGYDGALAYQALRHGDAGEPGLACSDTQQRPVVCRTVRAQRWGQLVLLGGILLGNLAALMDWRRGGRP